MRYIASFFITSLFLAAASILPAQAEQKNPFEHYIRDTLHIVGPVDVTQDDLTDKGTRYLLVLPKKEAPCATHGICSLYILDYQKPEGWHVVTTLRDVVAPVMVSTLSDNGWHNLIISNPRGGGFTRFVHNAGQGYKAAGSVTLPR